MTSWNDFRVFISIAFWIVYFVSFWLLTIGYFTPNWLMIDLSSGDFNSEWRRTQNPWWIPWHHGSTCSSIGLVNPAQNCERNIYNWLDENNIRSIKRILGNTFILMTTSVVVVYTNAMLLMTAIVFDLFHYSLYMSLLSISFGVFYPMAAILILVATIYVEASYTSDTGFSPMLCTNSGCLMLFLYIILIVYDKKFIKRSTASVLKPSTGWNSRGNKDITKLDPASFKTVKRNNIRPARNWGLRRT